MAKEPATVSELRKAAEVTGQEIVSAVHAVLADLATEAHPLTKGWILDLVDTFHTTEARIATKSGAAAQMAICALTTQFNLERSVRGRSDCTTLYIRPKSSLDNMTSYQRQRPGEPHVSICRCHFPGASCEPA